jgi:uncharacterized protein (TIGR04562 family)
MPGPYIFEKQILDCVVGGVSALDTPKLNIDSETEARQFVFAYGYDLSHESDKEQLWAFHRRAIALIQDEILEAGETIPEELADPHLLGQIEKLLLIASRREPQDRELQLWACAILRVMHVYVHLRNDLFSAFSEEIQTQILKPLQRLITENLDGEVQFGIPGDINSINLYKFDVKPFKTTASSVIKLLARPEKVALTLLDKLGVRFVTRNVYDSFRVIRFLIESHIISYPHIIPDQSNNTLYPLNIFLEVMRELDAGHIKAGSAKEIEKILNERLQHAAERALYLQKNNEFSGPEYRFIKFINRKLITVPISLENNFRSFRFFYPYEIQIVDYTTFLSNLEGVMAHDEYKKRQRQKARLRVLTGLVSKNKAQA